MLPHALVALTLVLVASAASPGTNGADGSGTPGTNGANGGNATPTSGSTTSGLVTPTNSAQLPSLSGVSSCVTDCLGTAASAAGCESEVAFDCFCATPKSYTTAFLACLTTCPTEVASAEALVGKFCAAASKPTSLSFASFTPSSTLTSPSNSASNSASSTATSPSDSPTASNSSSPPTNTGAAAAMRIPFTALLTSVVGVLLGAVAVL
ncbi:hypothetical protein C8R46DRAFT_438179 [Mycena filopes]|nr:hypothetical protein C8R46DRAFT_438179 [Mycena filopes]